MAAATTTSPLFGAQTLRPVDEGTRWYWIHVADQADTEEAGDIIKYFKLAEGSSVNEAVMYLGDFDSGTSVTHSLVLNDGTTEYEICKDVTIGQIAQGAARPGDQTTDEVASAMNEVITSTMVTNGAYVGLKTTAAPATATTTGRSVDIGLCVENRAKDRS